MKKKTSKIGTIALSAIVFTSAILLSIEKDSNGKLTIGITNAKAQTGSESGSEKDCYTYLPLGLSTVIGCEGSATEPRKCTTVSFVQKRSDYMAKCKF